MRRTASCIGKRDSGYGISSGSTNEIPAAKRKYAAAQTETIAAANTGSTRIASAGRQNHSVVVGAPGEPRPSTTSSIATIANSAISRSNQYVRAKMFDSAHASNVLHELADRLPQGQTRDPSPSTTHLRTGSLATTPRQRRLAVTAPHARGRRPHCAPLARARRCRHPRPDEAPEPLPAGPPRSLPRQPHRRRSELIKNDRFRSANCRRRPRAPMPMPTSNQGAESSAGW